MNMEMELPEGWKRIKLGNILSVFSGKGIKINNLEGGEYPVYGGNGINGYHDQFFLKEERLIIGRVGVKCGVMHITKPNSWVTDNALIITPKSHDFNIKFFKLKLQYENLNKLSVSTAQPVISGGKIYAYEINLPSQNEQQQIVQKIEELFNELDKGIENLKTAQQQLKVYRQAVLKWAFEGKLTNENVIAGELPKGWEMSTIGGHLNCIVPNRDKPKTFSGDIPWLTTPALSSESITVDYGQLKLGLTTEEVNLYKAKIIPVNSVVMTCVGTFGIAVVLSKEVVINQQLHALLPSKTFLSKYIAYSIKNQKSYCDETATTTTIAYLNKTNCNNIPIPLCSIKEQRKIVQEIESRLSVCDKIEETINTSLQQAEALRQSILKKAFEGKLVKAEAAQEAKVVSINNYRDKWERKVLAGKIIFACHKDRSFGNTKFQKTLFLCEYHAQLGFDTGYVKQVAGPLDSKFIYPFINEGKTQEWFVQDKDTAPYHFDTLIGIGKLTRDYPKYFKESSAKINFVINLLKDKNTDEAELIATIYAIWNNYLIENKELTFELLTKEVYDWDKSKIKFSKQQIASTWVWMKEMELVPAGYGKLITLDKK